MPTSLVLRPRPGRATIGVSAAAALSAAALLFLGSAPATAAPSKRALANPFFVFDNGVHDETYDTPAKRVALAKRIGFAGIEFLETLVDLGFDGPVGLQCYDVKGEKAEHLARSMAAWRACQARIAARDR
jgi:hypothetical protein